MDPAPRFLVIGAQKGATTWLYRVLRQHPGVWLPKEKELHFFDEKALQPHRLLRARGDDVIDIRWRRQVRRQLRSYRNGVSLDALRWDARYFLRKPTDAWYCSLFRDGAGLVTGEITPEYATLSDAQVAHVHRLMPDARIVYLLRNPIERVWSHAVMRIVRPGVAPDHDALRAQFRSASNLEHTDYLGALDTWTRHFPPEQVFVGFTEDVRFQPRALLERILAFLGAPEPPTWPDLTERVYAGRSKSMPAELAADIATLHEGLLEGLDERFGGYCAWWRWCGDRFREGGEGGEIDYPFTETPLWAQYHGLAEGEQPAAPDVQGAPLDALTASAPRDALP